MRIITAERMDEIQRTAAECACTIRFGTHEGHAGSCRCFLTNACDELLDGQPRRVGSDPLVMLAAWAIAWVAFRDMANGGGSDA